MFGALAWSACAIAQPVNKEILPLGLSHFGCGSFAFTVKGDTLVEDQTGDVYRILQNNRYGIVASASMSEFVPNLKKSVVAFFSIAIDRTTGQALWTEGVLGRPMESPIQLTCKAT
jgi:hypothetical protein